MTTWFIGAQPLSGMRCVTAAMRNYRTAHRAARRGPAGQASERLLLVATVAAYSAKPCGQSATNLMAGLHIATALQRI